MDPKLKQAEDDIKRNVDIYLALQADLLKKSGKLETIVSESKSATLDQLFQDMREMPISPHAFVTPMR